MGMQLRIKEPKVFEGRAFHLGMTGSKQLSAASALATIEDVQSYWRRNGLRPGSIAIYVQWLRLFLEDCRSHNCKPIDRLTAVAAAEFARTYSKRRHVRRTSVFSSVRSALRAWSAYLDSVGAILPAWSAKGEAPTLAPILVEYLKYRSLHCGQSARRDLRDRTKIRGFLDFVSRRKKSVRQITLADVDRFLIDQRRHFALGTVATVASSVREFLRFLHATGRLRSDLAVSVQCPKRRRTEVPRALPWSDIQDIIRAVDRSSPSGQRDFAILMLMAMYGFGAAEVISLRLDDVHWQERFLDVVRPKTGTRIRLPLLSAAARALAAYLRNSRPVDAPTRAIFVRRQFPHVSFSSSAIRYMVRMYARRAGVQVRLLGAHVFRHSHASRQIDLQAAPKVLSEILGHRHLETTSIYARVAVERLRKLALPVPR